MHIQHWVGYIAGNTDTDIDTWVDWVERAATAEQRGNTLIVLEVPKNDLLFFSGEAGDMADAQLIDFELMKALTG